MNVDVDIWNYRCFSDEHPVKISLRSGLTAFLGVNNAGKSVLLRFFSEFRDVFLQLMNLDPTVLHALRGTPQRFDLAAQDADEVFCDRNQRDLRFRITFLPDETTHTNESLSLRCLDVTVPRGSRHYTLRVTTEEGPFEANESQFGGEVLYKNSNKKGPSVSLARMIEVMNGIGTSMYIGPFRNALSAPIGRKYFDIEVGKGFIETWRSFKTGHVKRQNEIAYRVTQDIKRIFNFNGLDINPSNNAETLQFIVDGKSYRLSDLGAGLAQFVVVLGNVAFQNPPFVLIDEPELHLHPSLQLDFVSALASYTQFGLICATHSIGLARSCANYIYVVHKNPDGSREVRNLAEASRLSELLGELSYSGYRELGFDHVLLVEGPTDLLALQQWLRLVGKDHKVVMLPLGGKSGIRGDVASQLQEIMRICPRVSALIDSERDSPTAPLEKSRQAFVEACESAGITCHVLERRSLESYLADGAVKKVKGQAYRGLGPYERLNQATAPWAKSDNWRIAAEMSWDELRDTDLGRFLVSL